MSEQPQIVLVSIEMTQEMWERVEESAEAMLAGCVPEDREYNTKLLEDARNKRLTPAVHHEVEDQVMLAVFGESPQPGT